MDSILHFRLPSAGVALVTGANGITGQAIVERLVKEPFEKWSKIIITSRKPLKTHQLDPRVEFIALDFLSPRETIVERIKEICKDVTHAFFASYVHDNDFSKLHVKNGPLFRNFLSAVDEACPLLTRVVLQTGGKHYAFQFRDFTTPLVENTPRHEGPENIFYYQQEDDLFAIQKRTNRWDYNIIRPWAIVGYTPTYIGINEALPMAQYFLICRYLNEPPLWPGSLASYYRVENQSYAPSIADLTLWASTTPTCKNQAFNHTNGDVIVWKFLWHLLARYFKAPMADFVPPTQSSKPVDMAEWARGKKPIWDEIVDKYGGDKDAFQMDSFALMNWYITPNGESEEPFVLGTVSKARAFGWVRYDDSYKAWLDTYWGYQGAGVLPAPWE
ncbi:hypothetical protein BJY04DRAFT_214153 [Aspergillus karnatakaensis]|uniref:SDR family oxidoreductase n=1 Tax=Aspergillus karnatakaensis TaxID=1810916 RepID=UPI003CCD2276